MADKTLKSNYALIVLLVYYCYTQVTIGHGDFKLDMFEVFDSNCFARILLTFLFKFRNLYKLKRKEIQM